METGIKKQDILKTKKKHIKLSMININQIIN
jgi:hypothetical protein